MDCIGINPFGEIEDGWYVQVRFRGSNTGNMVGFVSDTDVCRSDIGT
jgi:hypothetical protein